MTNEIEGIKTNEFLRRRKLRLQQVREQSKDIAKKIRQRANVEKLRQVTELDASREREYLQRQEKLVQRLEQLYANGIKSVGTSHKSAAELRQASTEQIDLSKQRGREAAAELKKRKQEQLDERKKILDRKLQAREAANELSREKSSNVVNKLLTKASSNTVSDGAIDKGALGDTNEVNNNTKVEVKHSDMGTQWEDAVPNEWVPNVPTLLLPGDDRYSPNEPLNNNNNTERKSDKNKRVDLFAVSDEMPSSLRGGQTDVPEERNVKSSLTLVSEYIQHRGLLLRDTDITGLNKKVTSDLSSLKQTILKTRASKTEGGMYNDICHVLDEQIIPVPLWQAEKNCDFLHNVSCSGHAGDSRHFKVTNSEINKSYSGFRPASGELLPTPMLRGSSPFRRSKVTARLGKQTVSGKNKSGDRSATSSALPTGSTRKSCVTIYNHATRDTRDIPQNDGLVVANSQDDEDAYSQAMKESSTIDAKDREHQRRLQDMRNKIAMTKQNVEKEYKDTMTFLGSLPKDKNSRPIKTAYMDERRQQMIKESRQQKLQNEYRKIEKECRRHSHLRKTAGNRSLSQSKSPSKANGDFEDRDFQYSWMPVPDSDGSLAIHTIPTATREGKSGNTVKFSKVDSYHEYRSRHKHTPPTKDTENPTQNKRVVEAVIVQNSDDSSDSSSVYSTSSVEDLGIATKLSKGATEKKSKELTDAERIIIYKILDSKQKVKKNTKLISDIAKSLSSLSKDKNEKSQKEKGEKDKEEIKQPITNKDTDKSVSTKRIEEGVYKATNKNGDNISSLYFSDSQNADKMVPTEEEDRHGRPCRCRKNDSKHHQHEADINIARGERDDEPQTTKNPSSCVACKCSCADIGLKKVSPVAAQRSATASSSSFKTAANDKTSNTAIPDSGYIKITDDDGQEAGKFYIGASGFLKNDAYEVLIQLRKKDLPKEDGKNVATNLTEETKLPSQDARQKQLDEQPVPLDNLNDVPTAANKSHIIKLSDNPLDNNPEEGLNQITDSSSPDKINNANILQTSQVYNAENILNNKESDEPKNYSDKGVSTSFQLSYAIPSHVAVSDHAPKSATSTYTQTTATPPNQRPVFIHMSSSTSTAYMSPPEMVLPKYLRQDSDEMYDDTQQRFNYRSGRRETDGGRRNLQTCMCKSCLQEHKNIIRHLPCTKSSKCSKTKLHTPPNSTRSYTTSEIPDNRSNVHNVLKNKCRRCYSQTGSVKCCSKCNKNSTRNGGSKKRSCRNFVLHVNSSAGSSKSKTLDSKSKMDRKSNLNPFIKKYVDKLLSINKEGMKAIEVVNQECSAVTTPGSSIIDVPRNIDGQKRKVEQKISLQQIKTELMTHILNDYTKKIKAQDVNTSNQVSQSKVSMPRISKKKSVHKVKSLNISKRVLKNKKKEAKLPLKSYSSKTNRTLLSTQQESAHVETLSLLPLKKIRSKSSPTPRHVNERELNRKNTISDVSTKSINQVHTIQNPDTDPNHKDFRTRNRFPINKDSNEIIHIQARATAATAEREASRTFEEFPMNTSTQTSRDIDSEINYMKLAEDKLQNMEKIADLTEKCTKRLSSLAKVLEEVRRNKSLAYSQISTSDSASDSDHRSEKNANTNLVQSSEPAIDTQGILDTKSSISIVTTEGEGHETVDSSKYIPFLTNIPKPTLSKYPIKIISGITVDNSANEDQNGIKNKHRPPPALSRMNLKHRQGYITPHELSTVVEVDSPMSVKVKTQSSHADTKGEVADVSEHGPNGTSNDDIIEARESIRDNTEEHHPNPDLLQSNLSKRYTKKTSTDSSDDSKLQMMDLKQFNDIMLQPFISIQEYAKQCNIETLEGTNIDNIPKDDANDDLSSMQSDGSLPDVIAELLKRKIITEPFKYDTASNVNSTTGSSESTLSVLALSKVRKDKKKTSVMFQDKENVAETSDTLSFSSNPDLENAFKKLGMGWASSTLKKTKERLALSSSSNTSSSSMSQFKMKTFNNQDIPALVTDSVSSILNVSKRPVEGRRVTENSKNTGQQTSMTKSMTVKEFLTNELADKITFTNKSNRNDTEEEFVSLFETKMPEEMKHSSKMIHEEHTIDSGGTGNNRARTSTPVQIFKSMTYHSSSSSNVSNGLFSNADDLSSVKVTSNSIRNHSTSDKDDLTIPNCSLRIKKDASKSD